ncbi:alpha-ketoglutarate-dependent dioxygenase alkB homolog 6 [Diorhabda carinulata]|uniref:alpha-ketoglutarate-dependent dioxygenase alkB homolog 6 n=1 Tax=Diorhabda carinulata TaxID=1163345 RepID=UPI0025A10726|nr:alpha-ketoglutarate-dependent dioxygenase alkB homolog 6 [Diorhabda carinulata]
MDISKFKVSGAPPTIYYIPNFITANENANIIKNVYSVPKPKWTNLSNRRLQDYGGVPHEKGMIPEKIPNWLQIYLNKIKELGVFDNCEPNHVLVNEYSPGQGIMPHTDGPLFYPTICTISCGSHTILEFVENDARRKKVCDVFLEECSLVIIKDDLYSKYLHSICERKFDTMKDCVNLELCTKNAQDEVLERSTRISLTIRNVPKTLKINFFKTYR